MVYKHLGLLGKRVEDKVTGYRGIVTNVAFDLYGCIQAIVHPGMDKDGKIRDTNWFDVNRLTVLDDTPVMDLPDFMSGVQAEGRQGGDVKPPYGKV